VVFKEMKDVVKQEVLPSKEEPKKIEFDLKDDVGLLRGGVNQ
jgi:hypothetical protein